MRHSLFNMQNPIEVVVMAVMHSLIKILYVYQEKIIPVEEHDVMDLLMNGIMLIVLIN